jgi:hypothetical protein
MKTTTGRKPASFRLNSDLLEILRKRAKACNRSLNNYVESILLDAVTMSLMIQLSRPSKKVVQENMRGRLTFPAWMLLNDRSTYESSALFLSV